MKYALVGCGRVSPNHISAAVENGLEIIALCDIDIDKAKSAAAELPRGNDVRFYDDHRQMLEVEKPELTAIATFSGTHADIAVDCINAGSNVIIEKPIALSIADADRIIKAEEDSGLIVCANHQNRFNGPVQHMRKALLAGKFGKLFYGTASVRWSRGEEYYKSADWRGTWEQDGGTLMNQCIHAIDLLRWMMGGEITEVVGFTENMMHPYIECEDFGTAILRFKNGSYGIIDGTVNTYGGDYEETLSVFGEKGFAKLGGTCINKVDDWVFEDESEREPAADVDEHPPSVYGFGHKSLYTDVIKSIVTGKKPYVDSQAGKKALEAVLAIYKSAADKKPVKLPLESCSTLDFKDCR